MYPALLIFGLVLSAAVIFVQIKRAGVAAVAYYPITIFALYFAIIHFLTPLVKYFSGWFRYQSEYNNTTLVYSVVLSIVFLLFASALNEVFSRKTTQLIKLYRGTSSSVSDKNAKNTFWVGLAIALMGAFFAWSDLSTITSASGSFENFLLDRHLHSQARSSTRIFSNFLIPGSAAILAAALLSKKRMSKILLFGTLAAFTVYYANAISSRNTILVFALINLSVYFFFSSQRKTSMPRLNIKGLMLTLTSVAAIAGAAYYVTLQRYSISDSAYLAERREAIIFFTLDGAFGNDEARPWMIDNGHELYWGATYLAAVTNLIPRSIWPDKPLGAGPRLINMVRPGSFIIGQEGNNSLTTGLVVEARMNFGVPGVFLAIFLLAYFSNRMTRSAIRSQSILSKVTLIIAAVSINSMLLYSEFLGFFFRFLMLTTPLLIATYMQRISFRSTLHMQRGAN
ncbi:O-antigen ligase [Sulfitobacter sp. F26204]|uniref:O-antigen polymerase n=1 Tax=Sulfitobacter sp. F26204 TaxID=2996014 RepID=UPI00225E4E79|nr:O-antigen polymerase [Sulfitobacter sp. F26204]MCX7559710.1 O-antigen ligase [Sulfitobacter sp. F26204]